MIKCKTCGATLAIDHPFCPYCGNKNPYFEQHRQDMAEYEEEFQETREEVISHAKGYASTTVSIVILCVLAVANLFVFGLTTQAWNIADWMREQSINRNYETHKATLTQLEDGDYLGFYGYYVGQNGIYLSEKLEEFDSVYQATYYYDLFYYSLMDIHGKNYYDEKSYGYNVEYIVNGLKMIDDIMVQDDYDDPAEFASNHMAAMEGMQAQMRQLLKGYTGIDYDETISSEQLILDIKEVLPYAEVED